MNQTKEKKQALDFCSQNQAYRSSVLSMCTDLHLSGFRARFEEVGGEPAWQQISTEHQLYDLLSHETQKRCANAILRLHRKSNLPLELQSAQFSELYTDKGRRTDEKLLNLVMIGEWMTQDKPADLVISGACGVGKSFISACCANFMIRRRRSAYFIRAGRLFMDLQLHRINKTIEKRKAELKKIDLLILDDFLIEDMSQADCSDLLDIINDRNAHKPTIYTSQFQFEGWLERLGNTPLSQAVLDRIAHRAYRLHLEGPSLRENICSLPSEL